MNDVGVYLGRQREGRADRKNVFGADILSFEPGVVCFVANV